MESLSDIVAEYRRDYEDMKAKRLYLPTAEYLRRLLERIEAALKRERAAFDCECAGIAELAAKEEAERHKPGNAAATREAMERIVHGIDEKCAAAPTQVTPTEYAILHICKAALAAPARNCDKMPDIDNLTMHDLAKRPCKSTLEYASREELLALVRWLLAPAAERKGEGDGR